MYEFMYVYIHVYLFMHINAIFFSHKNVAYQIVIIINVRFIYLKVTINCGY